MRHTILFIAILIFAFRTEAQDVAYGVRAGLNVSHLSNFDPESKAGFHAGTYVKVPVTEQIWLQPELMFSQKGSSTRLSNSPIYYNDLMDSFYRRRKLTLHYIDLLAPARLDITKGFHVLAGPGASFLVTSLYKYNNGPDSDDTYDFVDTRRVDFVLHAGAGYEFKNGLMLGVRGEKGFVSVFDNQSNVNNFLIQLTAGFTVSGMRRFKKDALSEEEQLRLEMEEAGILE